MNLLLRCALCCVMMATAPAHADPVAECRATHGDNPQTHITCLERAIRERPYKPLNLGAEQVRKPETAAAAPAQITVEIVEVTYPFDGLGIFRMADGQVWKSSEQTPADRRLKPGERYTARIERGKLGGYRMYVDGVRRMFKVRRIE